MSEDVTVRDAPERSRYEAFLGDELAGHLLYARHGDRLTLEHTEVDPAFEGKGIGGRLAQGALDDIRSRGLRAVVECPFVQSWLERHPDYDDVVAP